MIASVHSEKTRLNKLMKMMIIIVMNKSQETTFFSGRQKLTSAMKLRPDSVLADLNSSPPTDTAHQYMGGKGSSGTTKPLLVNGNVGWLNASLKSTKTRGELSTTLYLQSK